MEHESSLPYSQVPATCPYPDPTPSSIHPLHFLKIHLNIFQVWVSPVASFPRVSPLEPFAHLSPPPCAPHALPTSFFSILPPTHDWVGSKDLSAPLYVIWRQCSILFRKISYFLNIYLLTYSLTHSLIHSLTHSMEQSPS